MAQWVKTLAVQAELHILWWEGENCLPKVVLTSE